MICTVVILSSLRLDGQIEYEFSKGQLGASVEDDLNPEVTDSLLVELGTSLEALDSLSKLDSKPITELGWIYKGLTEGKHKFQKALQDLKHEENIKELIVANDKLNHETAYFLDVPYGMNRLKNNYSYDEESNKVEFVLEGYKNSNQVIISGTFNNWSTYETPMQFKDGAWRVSLKLLPGKHLYKFIVDGEWILDSNNFITEHDGYGNQNNVYYAYNHEFNLKGYEKEKKVFVVGSFNGWYEKGLQMKWNGSQWYLPIYLREGAHTYKFKVGRKWITDPENPNTQPNGMGEFNSFLLTGNKVTLNVEAFSDAQSVFIAGDFNGWNPDELEMSRTKEGWTLEYALQPGNYEYKLIVDGNWKIDPTNNYTRGNDEFKNSVMSINPNYTFKLNGSLDAKEVLLTGNFINWNEEGYRMKKTENGWEFPLHLRKGKVLYKFIVDGEWIEDKSNPLWELNEVDSRNSVLWLN